MVIGKLFNEFEVGPKANQRCFSSCALLRPTAVRGKRRVGGCCTQFNESWGRLAKDSRYGKMGIWVNGYMALAVPAGYEVAAEVLLPTGGAWWWGVVSLPAAFYGHPSPALIISCLAGCNGFRFMVGKGSQRIPPPAPVMITSESPNAIGLIRAGHKSI